MFFSRFRKYDRLPVEEYIIKDNDEGDDLNIRSTSANSSAKLVAVCVLCTLLNILIVVYSYVWHEHEPLTISPASRGISRDKLDSLRRPSQFIGLENVYRNRTSTEEVKSFVNFPIVMAQIDTANPNQKTTPSTGVWTKIGTVYPETSSMLVSSSISTIVQFRAIDFGMETCELAVTIPSTANLTRFILSPSPIHIYELNTKKRLYSDRLTYASRPRRGQFIGEFSTKLGTSWIHRFACAMEALYAFELACPSSQDHCSLEWIQDKEHDSFPAIQMTQYSNLRSLSN